MSKEVLTNGETVAEEPSEPFLEPVVPGPTPMPAVMQITEAESFKYKYLLQLSINARMRCDMYSTELQRARRDFSNCSQDIQAFMQELGVTYGFSPETTTIDDAGFLVPSMPPR